MNIKAIDEISSLEASKRYRHFIKRVADFEGLWVLKNANDDIAYAEIDDVKVVPLWSDEAFANRCRIGLWEKYTSKNVGLEGFDTYILPFLSSINAALDIFPVGDKSGFVVSCEEYKRDLEEELENYE